MKKILILNWRNIKHPSAGGAEIATHEHAKFWVKSGYEVTWFGSSFAGAKQEEMVDGVKFVRGGSQLGTVFIYAFLYYMSLAKKPDLVVDQIHGMPFFTPLYARKSNRLAYIHEISGKVWFMNHLRFPLNYLYGIVGYVSEPIIFWLFYRNIKFMTVSNSTKRGLIKFGVKAKNIKVVHNGFTQDKLKRSFKKEKGVLMYLGALAKDKGVEDAIEVFSKVKNEILSAKLWIVGRGEERYVKFLKKRIEELGVNGVEFFGFVNEEKKYELLSRAQIMINPSRHEGWGLTNIEANSVGTPVIAYDVDGCRDSIENDKSGFLVDFNDKEKMAWLTIDLLSNEKRYLEMSKNSKVWSARFSWKESTKESLQLVKTML